jgi:hypothetical protein
MQDLNIPATAEQAIEQITKEQWMEYNMSHPLSVTAEQAQEIVEQHFKQHAPEPQPTLCESTQTDLPTIINNICTQLQLLATVISQPKAQPETGTNVPTLQETIALTLQQADWFKDLIRHELIGAGIEDLAKDAVESVVEDEVESYFSNQFDPTDHFDFQDAVQDAVSDQIDDVVRDQVEDKLEGVVAEKLSEASISISF